MQWGDVVELALRRPEVAEAVSYGEPSLKVRKRLLARLRRADNSLVLLDVPPEERDVLIGLFPAAFFCEPHYDGHDIVLARLDHAPGDIVERLIERRWRNSASAKTIAAFDSRPPGTT